MRTFDAGSQVAAVELKQMLVDYWSEVDLNEGVNIADFYVEDCIAEVSAGTLKGRAAISKYYADLARNRLEKGGGRTVRHTFMSPKVEFVAKDRATISWITVGYAGPGKPPVMDATKPVAVSDSRFECRRENDGQWRIVGFHSKTKFIGGDSFTQTALKNVSQPGNAA